MRLIAISIFCHVTPSFELTRSDPPHLISPLCHMLTIFTYNKPSADHHSQILRRFTLILPVQSTLKLQNTYTHFVPGPSTIQDPPPSTWIHIPPTLTSPPLTQIQCQTTRCPTWTNPYPMTPPTSCWPSGWSWTARRSGPSSAKVARSSTTFAKSRVPRFTYRTAQCQSESSLSPAPPTPFINPSAWSAKSSKTTDPTKMRRGRAAPAALMAYQDPRSHSGVDTKPIQFSRFALVQRLSWWRCEAKFLPSSSTSKNKDNILEIAEKKARIPRNWILVLFLKRPEKWKFPRSSYPQPGKIIFKVSSSLEDPSRASAVCTLIGL